MAAGKAIRLAVDVRMIAHSGIGTYLRNLLPALAAEKDFAIHCLGEESLLGMQPWFGSVGFTPLSAPLYSLREQASLAARIPECDIFWSPHMNVPLLPVRARKRLTTLHDAFHLAFPELYRGLKGAYARLLYRRAAGSDRIITVSEFSKSELERLAGVPQGRIRVVPNGVDPSIAEGFAVTPIPGDYLLFVGNLKPHKNLKNALLAFRALIPDFPELKFMIVGKREGMLTMDGELDSILATLPPGKAHLAGEVSLESLQNYYRHARLLVFPSLYEGFGLPILEAMCFGLPIVCSNRGPMREVGADTVAYFDPGDVSELSAAIAAALRSPDPPPLAAYRRRVEEFTWVRSAKSHAEIIRTLSEER